MTVNVSTEVDKKKLIVKSITFTIWAIFVIGSEMYYQSSCRGIFYIVFGSPSTVCRAIEMYQKPIVAGGLGLIGFTIKKYGTLWIEQIVDHFI